MSTLANVAWPLERAHEALFELGKRTGMRPHEPRASSATGIDAHELDAALDAAADECDLEIEPVEVPYAESETFLTRAAPALVRIDGPSGGTRLLALVRAHRGGVDVLAPDGTLARVRAAELRANWCADLERGVDGIVEPVLDAARLSAHARERARAAILAEHLGAVAVGGAWLVRLPPGRPLLLQARHARLGGRCAAVVFSGAVASVLGLAAWIALGRGALSGRFEGAAIAAWALLLASTIPLRVLEGWWQSEIAVRAGALFKRRLLAGAARLSPEDVRGEGAGHLLGRVLEAEVLEAVVLGAGFQVLGAAIDVPLAVFALAASPNAGLALASFAVIALATAWLARRHRAQLETFTGARLAMTQDLVERMVGHRTRVSQEDPAQWHVEEDRLLERYLDRSRELDSTALVLSNVLSAAWLLGGLALVASAFVTGSANSAGLAIGLGGVLLGQQALSKLSGGLVQLSVVAVTWRTVKPLFDAAARREAPGLPPALLRRGEPARETPLVEARGVSFRFPGRERRVLTDVDLALPRGGRVLVQGPSGGGKSTLAALLVGWRESSAGLLFLAGLDRRSHGARGWRALVSAAPQFHENHVFTGTLAFNVLLGAGDVRSDAQRARALAILDELGLAQLVARMPSGLDQIVGETGWQLSHGERSRVFVARALLQGGELTVFDESFAALDPANVRRAVECARRHARALVVVAHP